MLLSQFTKEVKQWINSNDYQIKKWDKKNNPILDDKGKEIYVNAFDEYQDQIFKAVEKIFEQMITKESISISNHPIFKEVKREIEVYRIAVNADVQQISLSGRVKAYILEKKEKKYIDDLTKEVKDWIISNYEEVVKKDIKGKIVTTEDGEKIKLPAYDYYTGLILPTLKSILEIGVSNDDERGKFDN